AIHIRSPTPVLHRIPVSILKAPRGFRRRRIDNLANSSVGAFAVFFVGDADGFTTLSRHRSTGFKSTVVPAWNSRTCQRASNPTATPDGSCRLALNGRRTTLSSVSSARGEAAGTLPRLATS